jgi:hypothetical protein
MPGMGSYGQQGMVGGIGSFAEAFLRSRQQKEEQDIQRENLKILQKQQKLKERDIEIEHQKKQRELDFMDTVMKGLSGGNQPTGQDSSQELSSLLSAANMAQGQGAEGLNNIDLEAIPQTPQGQPTPNRINELLQGIGNPPTPQEIIAFNMMASGSGGALQNSARDRLAAGQMSNNMEKFIYNRQGQEIPGTRTPLAQETVNVEAIGPDGAKRLLRLPKYPGGVPGSDSPTASGGPKVGGRPAISSSRSASGGGGGGGGLVLNPGLINVEDYSKYVDSRTGKTWTGAEGQQPLTTKMVQEGVATLKKSPSTVLDAGALKSAELVLNSMESIKSLTFDDKGNVNRGVLAQLALPDALKVGPARELQSLFAMGSDQRLRIATGAGMSESEAKRYAFALIPDARDSAQMVQWKIRSMEDYSKAIIQSLDPDGIKQMIARDYQKLGLGKPSFDSKSKASGKSDPDRAAARKKLGLE